MNQFYFYFYKLYNIIKIAKANKIDYRKIFGLYFRDNLQNIDSDNSKGFETIMIYQANSFLDNLKIKINK